MKLAATAHTLSTNATVPEPVCYQLFISSMLFYSDACKTTNSDSTNSIRNDPTPCFLSI